MDRSKSLYDVKIKLAEKYERLAKLAGSKPKQKTFSGRAVVYRRQAAQIQRNESGGN